MHAMWGSLEKADWTEGYKELRQCITIIERKTGEKMKWLRAVFLLAAGGLTGVFFNERMKKGEKQLQLKNYKKYECLYHLMHQWMTMNEMGFSVAGLLAAFGYKNIAIYGMADMGKHLYHALQGSEIKVSYCIDRGKSGWYRDTEIKKPEEALEDVDAVIVTAIMDFEEIKEYLQKKTDSAVVSLEEILYEGAWR